MTSKDDQRRIHLAQVLPVLAHDAGEPGQRAWTALAGMTARICGRYSAEARAAAAATAAEPEPASFGRAARLLARRADADARFASGFVPWLAAAQMLLPGTEDQQWPGPSLITHQVRRRSPGSAAEQVQSAIDAD
jgi:hypothetical protein